MPVTFRGTGRAGLASLGRVLASAQITYEHLASLRFYLSNVAYEPAIVAILSRHLGEHRAARTVICARLLEPSWLIEVEAVAARVE